MTRVAASIVVNNHNYGLFVGAAIESALAQDVGDVEVVVVDDGSTDDSAAVIERFGPAIRTLFKRNGGQASAFNAALPICQGDVVCFLDADDLLRPGAMRRALAVFAADPEVVKVSWPLEVIDADGMPSGRLLPEDPLPTGDLSSLLVEQGPDTYLSSPCSGNAWRRTFLDDVLPAPAEDFRRGADGYLITLAPLYGKIAAAGEPLGSYRSHGRNGFWTGSVEDRHRGALLRYDHRTRVLEAELRRRGLAPCAAEWRRRNPYLVWLERSVSAAEVVRAHVPEGTDYLLVDDGQWGESFVAGCTGRPFPSHDGTYCGPPADDEQALRSLDGGLLAGERHLVVGWPSYWWFQEYPRFASMLHDRFALLHADADVVVFDLGGRARAVEAGP